MIEINLLKQKSIIHKIWTDGRNLTCKGSFKNDKKFLIEWTRLKSSIFKHLAMVRLQSFWINFIQKSAFKIICQIVSVIPIVFSNNLMMVASLVTQT